MNIELCIATFRRPTLADTLASIATMQLPDDVDLRVIVVDNDHRPSASRIVQQASHYLPFPLTYVHAPAANISLARNAGLDTATAEWIAFLDDDECATVEWLHNLVACVRAYDTDAAFGPSIPIYPENAPTWITEYNLHQQSVPLRGNRVVTGHTCNALVRIRGTIWETQRFELSLGRTGGEDTVFFAALYAQGARFQVAQDAIVLEKVSSERLSFSWLAQRRFRIGQTYGGLAHGMKEKLIRCISAAMKATYCFFHAGLLFYDQAPRNFWMLRGVMHCGVCAGCTSRLQRELYGDP